MTLDEIKIMASLDLEMDKTELDTESLIIPQLHNKYLNFLTDEKLILVKIENDMKTLRKFKWLYYTGKLSQEELEEYELEPFQLNILKQDIDKFLDSDEDTITLSSRISYQKQKVDYLESTIKMISNRQWLIRSAIDWIKFTNGS
jgi:hypothetical protein